MFDTDAYLAALEKPSFTLDGKTYTGRLLSMEQFIPFAERFEQLSDKTLPPARIMDLYRDFLRALFPYRLSYRWTGDPVKLLMNSPALVPTVTDFFVCQVNAMSPKPLTDMTNGTN